MDKIKAPFIAIAAHKAEIVGVAKSIAFATIVSVAIMTASSLATDAILSVINGSDEADETETED